MMRNIAIGLAAATIAIGGSTLSVSAHHGQESGIGKGSIAGLLRAAASGPAPTDSTTRNAHAAFVSAGGRSNASASSRRANASVSVGSCVNASPSSPHSNASISAGS
jgi:hypothetical protein